MNCLVNIWNSFINSFLFDGPWWKDYGIPLLGAIGVPMLVWLLTWFYGAGRAEKQKELEKLRDNLNFILSVSLDTISKLISLRNTWINLIEIEKTYKDTLWNMDISTITKDDWNIIAQTYMVPMGLDMVNVTNYSSCIAVSENYVLHLIKLISAYKIVLFKIDGRNLDLRRISTCENLYQKNILTKERIDIDLRESEMFIQTLEFEITCLRDFIRETKELENKYKGLKLDTIKYSEDYKDYFKEVEDNIKKAKGSK